jgi:hypothetical protein
MIYKVTLFFLLALFCYAQRVVGSGQITQVSGDGNVLVTTKGSQTSGDCVKIDAQGNHVASGSACGGSGGTPGGSNRQVQYNNSGAFGGDSHFEYIATTAAPNTGPGVATHGAAGSTTYAYCATYHLPTGDSTCSATTMITTGNATLDATNYNVITAPACSDSNTTVDLFVTTAGGNISITGWIANVACGATYNHQGQNGDVNSGPPNSDRSPGVSAVTNLAVGSCFPGELANTWYGQAMFSQDLQAILWDGVYLNFFAWDGACSAPTALSHNTLGGISASGYDGTTFTIGNNFGNPPAIYAFKDGNVSAGIVPVGWGIAVGSNLDGSTQNALVAHADGSVQLYGSLITHPSTPASSSATCIVGQLTADVNFIYFCTASNTWKRAALTSF